AYGDNKPAGYAYSRHHLRRITQQVRVAQRQQKHEYDRNEWQTSFERSPPRCRFISRCSEREPYETCQADALRCGTGQTLCEQGDGRVELQECVILRGLARVEPDDIKEESPRHSSRPRPDQPGGGQNNEYRGKLIKQQNDKNPSVVRPLFCNNVVFSRRSIGSGSHHEFSTPLINDEAK